MSISFDALTSVLASSNFSDNSTQTSSAQNVGTGQSGAQNPMGQAVNAAVAKLLGVSTSTLQGELVSGQTLSSIAARAGVPSQTLVSTIAQTLADNPPLGAPSLSADQLTSMATDIANGVASPQPGQALGSNGSSITAGSNSSSSSTSTSALASSTSTQASSSSTQGTNVASRLDELANLLGIDPKVLSADLSNGTTLSQLLGQGSSASSESAPSTGISLDSFL